MNKKEYEKWLKKQGIHLSQLKERKPKNKPYKPTTNYASSYYEEKTLDGKPILKKEKDFSQESEKLQKEIQRKRELMLAMNMTGPRDLDYYVAGIDQIHLVSKGTK